MAFKQVAVIPARMSGTRLPGKPLIILNGLPMIHHVWLRTCDAFDKEDIYVATEDDVIFDYCEANAIQCVKTPKAPTAIDRIKLVSDEIQADVFINVQGDEPVINPADISRIANYSREHPDRIVFGKAPANEVEFFDLSKAKVVCSRDGKLLYSSRAGIPISNTGEFRGAQRAIWIYAFPKFALDAYYHAQGQTELDEIEDNEILRFQEIGLDVFCVDVIGNSWAVDEPKDIKIVEEMLTESGCSS